MRAGQLAPAFVEFIPDVLKESSLYVSIEYATAVHLCACGCGHKVVTPFSPTDWRLIYDGESVSLDPSIGNWSFDCQSHYWVRGGQIRWADRWSRKRIDAGRERDRAVKETYFHEVESLGDESAATGWVHRWLGKLGRSRR